MTETTTALCALLIFLVLWPPRARADQCRLGPLAQCRACDAIFSIRPGRRGAGVLLVWLLLAGIRGRPAHVVTVAGKAWNWMAAEPLFLRGLQPAAPRPRWWCYCRCSAWAWRADSVGRRNRPLAIGRRLRLTALLAGCTYRSSRTGSGRRVAGATGSELRPGARLSGCRRRRLHSSRSGLTAWSMACILGPRRGKYGMDGTPRLSRPQRRAGSVGLFSGAAGMVGPELRGRRPICRRRTGSAGRGGHRYHLAAAAPR